MRSADPTIGQAFAEWMVAQDHHKDHAAATPFRFSSVMGCARQLGYVAAGVESTDPMDGASLAITGMGSLLHEDIQKAVAERWPNATFEGKGSVGDLISGHYDIEYGDEIVEIKTVGAYKFDLSIGLRRSAGYGKPAYIKPEGGAGPDESHICQAGFNALAHGKSTVRIVYLSREAVSVQKAAEAGLSSVDRFWAEWVFTEDVWRPLVDAERARLEAIRLAVDAGFIPDRQDFDHGKEITPDPDNGWWRCLYCSHAHQCKLDGPGPIPIELS